MDPDSRDAAVAARRILGLVDLTSLGEDDTPEDIAALCQAAVTDHGPVASVCVWPRFVAQAVKALDSTAIPVCAVANFPAGADDVDLARADSRLIVDAGGGEVDVVVPWRDLAAGRDGAVERLVTAVRDEIGPSVLLKAILETGELDRTPLIEQAAVEALDGGADVLKTSTGKTATSATPAAAETLIAVVRAHGTGPNGPGIKISGGVSTLGQAIEYLDLVDAGLGSDWVGPRTFRFGASRLLGALMATIDGATAS